MWKCGPVRIFSPSISARLARVITKVRGGTEYSSLYSRTIRYNVGYVIIKKRILFGRFCENLSRVRENHTV